MAKKKTSDQMKIAIIVSLIIGASIVMYGYLNYKTKMDTTDREAGVKLSNQEKIQECQSKARVNSSEWWDRTCADFGMNQRTPGCTLPQYNADTINKQTAINMDNCVKLYSAN